MFNFCDCNLLTGLPATGSQSSGFPLEAVQAYLDRESVAAALVRHHAQKGCSPQAGNALLDQLVARDPRLTGCWALLPPQTGEVITDDFFSAMKQARAGALCVFPDPHHFSFTPETFGPFLEECIERRVPFFIAIGEHMDWTGVEKTLRFWPRLTCILADIGVWGQTRKLWPLLEHYPNVHVETSMLSIGAENLSATVQRFGAGRLIFGSGMPARYPRAALLDLLHADIDEADKQQIARNNFCRLLNWGETT